MAGCLSLILTICLFFGSILTNPLIINAPSNSNLARQSDVGYRLNSEVIPTAYVVTITPSFDTGDADAFTFEGQVQITVRTQVSGLTQIKLHSRDLNFTSNDITVVSTYNVQIPLATVNPLTFETAYDFATINLSSALVVNIDYIILITYRGPVRDDMTGFYRSSYLENGVTKWLGITQFESVHARKTFPCFDEPAYKATFTFVINRPESYQPSLANTKLQNASSPLNGRVTETFYPSPVMPTYLGAILVSEFESGAYTTDVNGNEMGIWSRPQAKNQSAYAHDIASRLLHGFRDLVGIDYYSPETMSKLDHLAIPDFNAGAMENWGLITYRESYIMWDPLESNSLNKQTLAAIISHETAHMWFGNLVTCHWWSDIWLNEGHARYFQYYVTHLVEPTLDMENAFVTDAMRAAFSSDQVPSAPALTNEEVNSPSEISGHFGAISYSKGASVIRMIHHWIGNDAFTFGLNSYLTTQKFTASRPTDLYAGLQRGADNYLSLANYSGFTVANVMSTWVTQAGFPLVQVDINYDTNIVNLTQNRFYANGSLQSGEIYAIPITYVTKADADYDNTKPAFVFNTKTFSFNITELDNSYIVLNKQVTGYYRVNYDLNTWNKIIEVLQSTERTTIHKINRAQIVDDAFALLSAEIITIDLAFKILGFLSEEIDYYVWSSAISGYTNLQTKFKTTDPNSVKLTTLILNQLSKVVSELGYVDSETEDHPTRRNRMQILDFACALGHGSCLANAATALKTFRIENIKIAPNLRPFAYCYGLAAGNEADYDFLLNQYHSANVISDRFIMERALSCTGVESRIHDYLALAISENSTIRNQDLNYVVGNVIKIRSNLPVVLQYIKDNYVDFGIRYVSGASVINSLASVMATDEDLDSLESWVPTCTACTDSEKEDIISTIQSTRSRFGWSEGLSDELTSIFDSALPSTTEPSPTDQQGSGASKSTTVLTFVLFVVTRLSM